MYIVFTQVYSRVTAIMAMQVNFWIGRSIEKIQGQAMGRFPNRSSMGYSVARALAHGSIGLYLFSNNLKRNVPIYY